MLLFNHVPGGEMGNSSFVVQKIFLDETPFEYDASNATYYKDLVSKTRRSDGLVPNHYVSLPTNSTT